MIGVSAPVDGVAKPVTSVIDDRAAIDGVGNRLAHARVVERLLRDVEAELLGADADRLVAADPARLPAASVPAAARADHVNVAGLERQHAGGAFGDGPVDKAPGRRRATPVTLDALEHDS